MDWYAPNKYDECAWDDLAYLAELLNERIRHAGAMPELSDERLTRQLVAYVGMRHRHRWHEISAPQHARSKPVGWKSDDEHIWQDWLTDTITLDDWRSLIGRVFGTDERFWEVPVAGWREEVYAFLPFWVQRSAQLVAGYDPRSKDVDDDEGETDTRESRVDVYILEHGTAKQRRAALRS